MRYEILLAPEAVEDLESLQANTRAAVHDAIEHHLRHEPTKRSKSRIKRLQDLSHPQYRLRVGDDIRVFFDVTDEEVQVLAIVLDSHAEEWLRKHGESDETGATF
jgi:mRNA-degrading endonuclease RelE of RelBE toxin-antitoxin system